LFLPINTTYHKFIEDVLNIINQQIEETSKIIPKIFIKECMQHTIMDDKFILNKTTYILLCIDEKGKLIEK